MGRSLHPKCGWDYSLGRKGGDTQGQSRLCARVCCSLFPDVSPCCLDFPTTVGCTLTLLVKINLLFWVVFGCVPNLVFKNQFIHVLYIIYSSCTHLPTKLRLLGVLLKPWEKASNTKAKSFLHKRKKKQTARRNSYPVGERGGSKKAWWRGRSGTMALQAEETASAHTWNWNAVFYSQDVSNSASIKKISTPSQKVLSISQRYVLGPDGEGSGVVAGS